MTAPSGPILFNTSTGSDTAASGLGNGGTALSAGGNNGASTNGTTTVTLSADTPDLSGVSAGDMMWVDSSSGPQFSVIASANDGADTVTVDVAYTQTESDRNWGIGGKRNDFNNANSRKLFEADYLTGWIVETETDQTISTAWAMAVSLTAGQQFTVRGSAAHKVFTQSGSGEAHIAPTSGEVFFKRFQFKHSHATNEYVVVGGSGSTDFYFDGCICGDASSGDNPKGFIRRGAGGINGYLRDSVARFATEDGFGESAMRGIIAAHGCVAHDCGRDGFAVRGDGGLILIGCVAYDNGGRGAHYGASGDASDVVITRCHFVNNTEDGIGIGSSPDGMSIYDNVITANGQYGIESADDLTGISKYYIDYNAFRGNTSGQLSNVDSGANDITLTADPHVDSANGDMNINDTSGGGTVLRAVTRTLPT